MGLDQYAYAVMPSAENTDLGFAWDADNNPENYSEIYYWRKHPNLQGWMEKLYQSKGGEKVFNCTPVRLSFQDINDLEEDVNGSKLPSTTGFFFGESTPEIREQDLEFIRKAREAMSQDMEVYYDSWW
jgi:hypothetical protein